MPVDDPQKFKEGLRNEQRRLAESETVHEADREAIDRWIRRKDGQVKVSSLKTYLRRARIASERSEVRLVDFSEADYHDLVFELRHEHDLADSTVQAYENAILLFLQDYMDDDVDWPETVERTKVDDQGPTADEILTPADVQALVKTASHSRDVAFIEFLADSGARLSLALSLRVGDVGLKDPATYTPNEEARGLKGADIKEYPLIDAAAPLRGYVRGAHPRPTDPGVALFHKRKPHRRAGPNDPWGDDDGGLDPNAARQQLQRIADRAGVDKPVNPHAFRHTAITRMVREGYSRSQIEHRVHWTLDTDMWETYEHITSQEHNADIFREAGVVDDDGPDRVRKRCGGCRSAIAPRHEFCPQCGKAVTADAEAEVRADKDTVLDDLVEATSPAAREELRELLDAIDESEEVSQSDPS